MVSGFLQFAVLPQVMQLIEPSTLWRIVPAIVVTFASNMSLNKDPSLYLIAGTFLTMKALEFSARRMLDEMVYVPLDYDAVSFAAKIFDYLIFPLPNRPSCLTFCRILRYITTPAIHWQGSHRRFGISIRQERHLSRCFGSYFPIEFWYFGAQLAHVLRELGMGQLHVAIEQPCTDQGGSRGSLCQNSWQERKEETLATYGVVRGELLILRNGCYLMLTRSKYKTHQYYRRWLSVNLCLAWLGIQLQNAA